MENNGVPVQYYIDTPNVGLCLSLLITHRWFGACFLFTERASLLQYIDGTILFGFGPYPLITLGLSVRQYMTQWSKRCTCSVRVPYSLKNRLVFGPYRPEKETCYIIINGKFKFQIDLDRQGPRQLLNDSHLAERPPFSLYTTFKLMVSWIFYRSEWLMTIQPYST